MKNTIKLLLITGVCMGLMFCKDANEKSNNTEEVQEKTSEADTTPRVTGIGGIFFKTSNPDSTKNWYATHLGLNVSPYGCSFEFRNGNRPDEINYLEWSPFTDSTKYFKPSSKDFMINYRVQNLEGLVRKFKENGVQITDTMQSYEYGKFIHIMDPDGNKIELWEPVDSVFTKMGGPTTK